MLSADCREARCTDDRDTETRGMASPLSGARADTTQDSKSLTIVLTKKLLCKQSEVQKTRMKNSEQYDTKKILTMFPKICQMLIIWVGGGLKEQMLTSVGTSGKCCLLFNET